MIASRVTRVRVDTQIPWMLMLSTLSLLAKEKGRRDGNARKGTGKQSSGKGKQSKSWSKSEGEGKSKENKLKSKRKV